MKILNDLMTKNSDLKKNLLEIDNLSACLYYFETMVDINSFNEFYIKRINQSNIFKLDLIFPGVVTKIDYSLVEEYLYNGLILIYEKQIYCFKVNKSNKRSIQEPQLDPLDLIGAKDGFIEDIETNLYLLRKKIKSSLLSIETFEIGEMSKTKIAIVCFKETLQKNYYKIIKNKVLSYKTPIVASINDIAILFQNNSLVPLSFATARPSTVIDSLNKEKVAILVDNFPTTIILPTTLSNFTSIKEEINTPNYYTIFNRIFISFFFFLSIFLLGAFIAVMNYHTNLLSIILIANLKLTEKGTSFPIFIEIILVLLLFEFYRFATSRSPTNYVQNIVIIFGGLFIGQNAIYSGTVGAIVLIIASLSYISSYAITTNPHLIISFSILRLFNLISSYTLGLYGFVISSILILIYLIKQKSVGECFLRPFIPLDIKKIKAYFTPTNKEAS